MDGILNQGYQKVSLLTLKKLVKVSVSKGASPSESLQAIDGASSVQQLCVHLVGVGEVNSVEEAARWLNGLVEHHLNVSSVLTMEDFLQKYGYHTLRLVVETFIKEAPSFPREKELAGTLGYMMADLETALKEFSQRSRK